MATKYELSKTYQYRKVMKPLLERKRRARINKCLDELKELMAECVAQTGEPNAKFEKADILEVTVQHLRKLKQAKAENAANAAAAHKSAVPSELSFRAGYIRAANEVSRALAALPKVDVTFGTTLMTHLGMRLNQLECAVEQPTAVHTPLSINCSRSSYASSSAAYSPVSSGYASDSDCSSATPGAGSQQLLQVSSKANVWRPW